MYRIIPREKNVTSGVFKLIYYLLDSTREKYVILLIVIIYVTITLREPKLVNNKW